MSVSGTRDIQPQSTEEMVQNTSVSYSQVCQQDLRPKREHAIVTDVVEGLSIKDYAIAIAKKVGGKSIISISRISHGRVCVYLNSQETADKLVEHERYIEVNNNKLEIRPLVSKTKRIIISNVQTVIPNSLIERKFEEFNVNIRSKITTIKTGWDDLDLSHVESFRRAVYIDQDDVNKLPELTQIVFENIKYYIYISTQKLTCFLCKEEGHLAKHCANANILSQEFPTIQSKNKISLTKTSQDSADFKVPAPNTSKRVLSISTVSGDTVDKDILITDKNKDENKETNDTNKEHKVKHINKRIKTTSNFENILLDLEPARKYFNENSIEIPVNIEKISTFLSETYGKTDIKDIALKNKMNEPETIDLLKLMLDHINNKTLRARVIRVIKRLENSDDKTSASDDCTSSEEQ